MSFSCKIFISLLIGISTLLSCVNLRLLGGPKRSSKIAFAFTHCIIQDWGAEAGRGAGKVARENSTLLGCLWT